MKTVALASIGFLAASSLCRAAVQATYRVTQDQPAFGQVRRIIVTRTADRCLIWSVGAHEDQLCVFSPQGTLVAERGGRLESFIPYTEATMRAPESTGRVRYLPPLFGDLLTWEPLYTIPVDGRKIFFNLDVLSGKGDHMRQFAQVDQDRDGNVVRLETQHNGVIETAWEFADFRKEDRWRFPGHVERRRYRASGLNIPANDRVSWDLVSIKTIPDSSVDDFHLLANGATVTDLRPGALGRVATFERAQGPLESQWRDRPLGAPSAPSPTWPKLLLGVCLGGGIAVAAVAHHRKSTL